MHPAGDSAVSKAGIVFGHAYSILDLKSAGNIKLLQIRNPWGQGEWNGAYSDKSDKWTTRLKNVTGFDGKDKNDGIFWIELGDYMVNFEETYICMDLAHNNKFQSYSIDS